MKFISRVEQDISLVRFAHSWDILVNTRNEFHISAHPVLLPHKNRVMRFMIIDTCEIIMNNHTCEIIDFICGGNVNKTLYFIQ